NINNDTNLQAVGVTATSSGAVITVTSTSNTCAILTSVSPANQPATETMTVVATVYSFVSQIDGPMPGNNDVTSFTYDGFGRVYTVTDSEGYVLTFGYDAMDRQTSTTYPDGTTDQTVFDKLDAIQTKDRIGRVTQRAFDSLDQLAFEI